MGLTHFDRVLPTLVVEISNGRTTLEGQQKAGDDLKLIKRFEDSKGGWRSDSLSCNCTRVRPQQEVQRKAKKAASDLVMVAAGLI